jgi:phosphoribosyl 1,2-cyclic phosphodiesterase
MELGEAFDRFMRPPYFPVQYTDLVGDIRFHTTGEGVLELDGATVLVREVPHVGTTLGYRVDIDGVIVAYMPDHQMPMDGTMTIAPGVLELAAGADVLIHDAQYTPEEFAERAHWGHCTVEYAVHVARAAEVQRLVLFHHDPGHCDTHLDELLLQAREEAGPGIEVLSAAEGMTLSFDRDAKRVRARVEA